LTDGEPLIFPFGNPTRSTGKFYCITFGSERERWIHCSIDSRNCAITNKRQIAEWMEDYGEDSDFFGVAFVVYRLMRMSSNISNGLGLTKLVGARCGTSTMNRSLRALTFPEAAQHGT
jgi:hypothetical protein